MKIMENPIEMDALGGKKTYFGNTHLGNPSNVGNFQPTSESSYTVTSEGCVIHSYTSKNLQIHIMSAALSFVDSAR